MGLRTRSKAVCLKHNRHATYEDAAKEMSRLFMKKGAVVEVFPSNPKKPCEFCGGWHVGHLRKDSKAREQLKRLRQKHDELPL